MSNIQTKGTCSRWFKLNVERELKLKEYKYNSVDLEFNVCKFFDTVFIPIDKKMWREPRLWLNEWCSVWLLVSLLCVLGCDVSLIVCATLCL